MHSRLISRPALGLAYTVAWILAIAVSPAAGDNVLISVNHDGSDSGGPPSVIVPPTSGSWVRPQLSADGRFVLFGSYAQDLVSQPHGPPQAFVRDVWSQTTQLVNVTPSGEAGNATSLYASFTPDGRYVVYQTGATNVSPNDPDSWSDVYVRDLLFGTTQLVSVNNDGVVGDSNSQGAVITPDGRYVAFSSWSDNLAENATEPNIYLRDLHAGTTTLVSPNVTGTGGGNASSRMPSLAIDGRGVITDDGRYVVFKSNATDLTSLGAHSGENLYVRDVQSGVTEMISVRLDGSQSGNGGSNKPHMTPDGRYVVFTSTSSDLVANDLNGNDSDVFVRDRLLGLTILVSANALGTSSGNGESGVFWPAPQITPDGRYVVFHSFADDLSLIPDGNGTRDVFVRDLLTQTTQLVSVDVNGLAAGNGSSAEPRITDDGRYVFFYSGASNLVAGDDNAALDVFVRDMLLGTTKVLSLNKNGDPANGSSASVSVTADGHFATFVSLASDLVETDNNEAQDVFRTEHVGSLATGVGDGSAGSFSLQSSGIGRGTVEFRLRLPEPGSVQLTIFDAAGKRVATLAERFQAAGEENYIWDTRAQNRNRVASGVYVARAVAAHRSGESTISTKFVVIR